MAKNKPQQTPAADNSVQLPEYTLLDLRNLRMRCEAVACCRALGLANDLKVQAIGRAAHRAIKAAIGDALDDLATRRKAINAEIVTGLQADDLAGEALEAEFQKAYAAHPELREIQKTEAELWSGKVPFQAQPVTIPLDALKLDDDAKLPMPASVPATYRELALDVEPYACLLKLVEDEILILNDE